MLHIGTDNPYLVTGPGAWTAEGGVNDESAAAPPSVGQPHEKESEESRRLSSLRTTDHSRCGRARQAHDHLLSLADSVGGEVCGV
ncbi:hypothetical protein VTN00DRAFT_3793 [Thermoascus crustaceus]|uniref:uncharacterized protein n=1 Tax=Thermoascus crustaceus TaxID=5088 RepID=UPI0037430921